MQVRQMRSVLFSVQNQMQLRCKPRQPRAESQLPQVDDLRRIADSWHSE